jgi:hypothetical protein
MRSLMFAFTLGCAMLFTTAPASADPSPKSPSFTSGAIIAVLFQPGVSQFEVSNMGTVPSIFCQDPIDGFEKEICDQCFAVCVDQTFDVGACGTTGVNLNPAISGPSLNRPFYYTKPGKTATFLPAVPLSSPPSYNLGLLPRGTEVWLITENRPTLGHCVGVRTSFKFTVGTCDLCKTRKLFNTCAHSVRITGIHEWEQPCEDATFSSSGLTAFAEDDDELLKFWIVPGSGAYPAGASFPFHPSAAGSTGLCAFDFDTGGFVGPCSFFSCGAGAPLLPGEGGGGNSFMELFFSFFPGGSNLAPAGKPGSERFHSVCFSITHLNGGGG